MAMIRRSFLAMLAAVAAVAVLFKQDEGPEPADFPAEITFPAEVTSIEALGEHLFLTTAEPALYRIDRRGRVRLLGDLPGPLMLQVYEDKLLLGSGYDDAWYVLDLNRLWGIGWP